jgi:hypothetical protein
MILTRKLLAQPHLIYVAKTVGWVWWLISILSDWTLFCVSEGCPLSTKSDQLVRKEFEKRKHNLVTKEAKAKLDLQHCLLGDDQVRWFVCNWVVYVWWWLTVMHIG